LILASVLSPTQAKWNHSTAHASFSHAIISPNDTRLHTQYLGSSGLGAFRDAPAAMPNWGAGSGDAKPAPPTLAAVGGGTSPLATAAAASFSASAWSNTRRSLSRRAMCCSTRS
jgi:hypothetical protein